MRIWILSSELASQVAGGIARYVDIFSRLLSSAGHEVVVIAQSSQPIDEEINPGLRVIGLEPRYKYLGNPNPTGEADSHPAYPYNTLNHTSAFSYQLAEEVLSLLERLPAADVIESQEYSALPYFLIQRKLTEKTALEHIPILIHLHSPYFELARVDQMPRYNFPAYWIGQMEKFCLRAADALLCPSRYLARSIQETLKLRNDISVIPHPVPFDHGFSASVDAAPGHLVCVGRLQVLKGVLPLLKACHRLWSAGQDFKLNLIGGDCAFMGDGATTVSALMEKRYGRWLKSGHLQWLGQLEHGEAMEQMRQAWAVVIPSLIENFPNTCIEAMGMGQVVLGSSTGGHAEMIQEDGVNGFIFDRQVPGDLKQKLLKVLSLHPEERWRLGQRAQSRIQTLCDPHAVLRQRLAHYQKMVATYQPKRLFPGLPNRRQEATSDEARSLSWMRKSPEEQEDLLSVLIPYYNLGDYLEKTLNNVLASTYSPLEVIIINDGSTDPHSLEVLRNIEARRLPQVRVLHTENQGLALTRSYGAEHARGEFIAFVDADNLVEPDFFQRAIDVLQRYPNVSFVYPWFRYFGAGQGIWPTWNAEFPYLLGHNMCTVLVVIRRSAFLPAARNKEEFEYGLEEYEDWVSLLEAGGIGVSLPFPLARYRVRPDSMYQSCGRNQLLYLYDLLTQHHSELYREWGVELFNLQCANGPGYIWSHPAVEISPWEDLHQQHQYQLQTSRSQLEATQSQLEATQSRLEMAENQIRTITSTLRWRVGEQFIHSSPGRLAWSVYMKLKK